jgi:polyisoprenoid-binding protein YceI
VILIWRMPRWHYAPFHRLELTRLKMSLFLRNRVSPLIALRRSLLALALLIVSSTAHASEQRRYRIDSVHTRVVFFVDHAGFSRAVGQVLRPRGWLWWNESNPAAARVDVRMDASAIDFGDSAWNKAMQGKRYFHMQAFPSIRFRSLSVLQLDEKTGELTGELELLGVKRPVRLQYTLNKQGSHPMIPRATIGFSARGELQRSDFGMNYAANMIGDRVELIIELEAIFDPPPAKGLKR